MNILYCGDIGITDGLIISVLSLIKNVNRELNIYVFTMEYEDENKKYTPLSLDCINYLDRLVKNKNEKSFVKLIDITKIVNKCLPKANIDTRFTPYCMLRLYADQVKELPKKVLYLDNDVVCMKDPSTFYDMDITNYEIAGVLDYYGSHFFRKKILRRDYLNSGVLLMNLDLIRKTTLFAKCRRFCQKRKMMLPDQDAINMFSKKKLKVSRIYNEQKKLTKKTVFRHFSTTFKFWPTLHTQTIKPWHIDKLHEVLNIYEIDGILKDYQEVKRRIENE